MRRLLPPVLLALAAVLITHLPLTRHLDLKLLDMQFRFLRDYFPRDISRDVVIIGVNDDTFAAFPEPQALWHKHFGRLFQVLAGARPAAVGVDFVLPDRSVNSIMPGADQALLAGILALRKVAPVVLGITVDPDGKLKRIYPPFVSVAGPDSTGYALWATDPDGLVRRYDEHFAERGGFVPTLAGTLARRLGVEPREGLIDYSVGKSFEYVPLHQVLEWAGRGEASRIGALLEGKTVLIGTVQPFVDQIAVPLNLSSSEFPAGQTPGVLVHAQALRGFLNDRIMLARDEN